MLTKTIQIPCYLNSTAPEVSYKNKTNGHTIKQQYEAKWETAATLMQMKFDKTNQFPGVK